MIMARLDEADRYASLHPGLAKAFAFLRRSHLAQLAVGRHEIDGDRAYAMVIQSAGRPRDAVRLEAHRKYVDVQYSLDATEEMGWKSRPACTRRDSEYDADKDIEFFADAPESWIALPPRHFVIFFPEDAHAPMVAQGNLHKVVVKLAV
jgi:YhcH/YjgK/YiaL family protein